MIQLKVISVKFDENPEIQISNVAGNYVMLQPGKLILNNPDLFGTYKSGDIIPFIPTRLLEEKASVN